MLTVDWLLQSILEGQLALLGCFVVPRELLKDLFLDKCKMSGKVQIAIGEQDAVRRVIVLLVESLKVSILEVGDVLRFTAGVEAVL